jgi:hypothetical protein
VKSGRKLIPFFSLFVSSSVITNKLYVTTYNRQTANGKRQTANGKRQTAIGNWQLGGLINLYYNYEPGILPGNLPASKLKPWAHGGLKGQNAGT